MRVQKIVVGGGCFWCTEAVFKMIRGIISAVPGYAGGTTENPTYERVCSGNTGHAEVIEITYNEDQISFRDILTVFFGSHDPSTINRQGNDVGTQYRSVIFYSTEDQKTEAGKYIQEIQGFAKQGRSIVTVVEPLQFFYAAETYHQDYAAHHKDEPYCELVINPKLEKVQKEFAHLIDHKQ